MEVTGSGIAPGGARDDHQRDEMILARPAFADPRCLVPMGESLVALPAQ